MQALVDLHIHSCLSPCADEDMTPLEHCGHGPFKGAGRSGHMRP